MPKRPQPTHHHHHHHHLFRKKSIFPRSARVRRSSWNEAPSQIPEHCPFRVQSKRLHIILHTFIPSLPSSLYQHIWDISPLPPSHFYRHFSNLLPLNTVNLMVITSEVNFMKPAWEWRSVLGMTLNSSVVCWYDVKLIRCCPGHDG